MRMTPAIRNRSLQNSQNPKSQKKDLKQKEESTTLPKKINLLRSKKHVVVEKEEAVRNKDDTTMTVRYNPLQMNARKRN